MDINEKPSALWYVLPIFLGMLGGLISYVATRRNNLLMACDCMALGFVSTGVWIFKLSAIGLQQFGLDSV